MAQNLQLDPMKKDYVVVNGSPVPSDRVLEAAYYALTIPRGKWMYGTEEQGSLLYLLENIKRTSSIEQLFSSYSLDAIRGQLINTGKATDAQVRNIQATRTGSSNQIEIIPNQSQVNNQLSFVPV